MDAASIAQKTADRYHRALRLVEAQHVTPNGQPHQFYVRSQNGRGRYLAATSEAIPPLGTCSCKDWASFGRHNEIPCKHIQAARIYELAIETAKTYAAKHMLTYSRLADKLLYDLNVGMKEPLATKVVILFHACLRLARREEMTGPVELGQIRHSIVKSLAGIREIHERLRDNNDDKVAQAELGFARQTLNDLNGLEARMLLAYH